MAERYENLHDYIAAKKVRRWQVAQALGITRNKLAGLLYPDRYPVTVTDEMAAAIAKLLNKPVAHVRKMYPRAA